MGKRIPPALFVLLAVAAIAVASAPEDGAVPAVEPGVSGEESGDGGVAEPEPAAAEPEPAVAEPEPEAAVAEPEPPRRSSAVPRRRDASVIGGWVRSTREDGAIAVEEIVLGSNGEWRRREAKVSPESGLAAPQTESAGTWFTQEGTLVLLEQGSLVIETMRAPYLVDDRGDTLTLTTGDGTGPDVFYRFR